MNTLLATASLPNVKVDLRDNQKNLLPNERVSILSKIWFCWMNGLIHTGYKRDLTRDDLWEMNLKETTEYNTERLEFEWNNKANAYIKKKCQLGKEDFKLKKPSFAWALFKAFHGKFLGGSILRLQNDSLNFVGPILLDHIINFFKDKEQKVSVGIFFTVLLFLTTILQSFSMEHQMNSNATVSVRVRNAIMNLVYKKVEFTTSFIL